MAPEVMSGGEYSEKADVYSFGIIMWELVSRQMPFAGLNTGQISVAVLQKGYRPPIPDKCPSHYSALMQACWHQAPESRPPFSFVVDQLNGMYQESKKKGLQWDPLA
jgi:serine/threonine protein kinase